ncbi:DUF6090 family protein [Winogradskyella maritima]|uniref:DUF6090 family protein n=1 Tax=Winogradskyella maritima TaxID=1517766 RepID=A0ABV8AK98_9FLAO|nr:DUF6090 family protein [Winogradskyella maritima]
MIKFFRQIRLKSMENKKTSRYFKYAIGEIILVVIGILIALQINNWNEIQKTNTWEKRFLKDLRNELKNDYEQLTAVYNMQINKGNANRNVLELIKTATKDDKAMIDSVYAIAQYGNRTFFPTTGVYDSALSAGKIENIKNDSLKYGILNLYNHFYKRLIYNGEVLDGVVGKVDWENKKFWSESDQTLNSWESIKSHEFKTQTEYLIAQNSVYTRIAKGNLEQIRAVMEMISNELENNQ